MNILIANKLVELRKKNGLSQEELADKLGISRQAVSKWERAESSPDTDNLICLAKLYNVSLDDLLNTDETVEEISEEVKEKEKEKKKTAIKISHGKVRINGVEISRKNKYAYMGEAEGKRAKFFDVLGSTLTAVLFLVAAIVYFLVPYFYGDQWSKLWVIFLIPVWLPSILTCIKKRRITPFIYPVFITNIYLVLGLYFGIWHPTWVLFITIPVFYTMFRPVDKAIASKRNEPVDPEDEMNIPFASSDDDKDDDDKKTIIEIEN